MKEWIKDIITGLILAIDVWALYMVLTVIL
jgi:hypothetical protein